MESKQGRVFRPWHIYLLVFGAHLVGYMFWMFNPDRWFVERSDPTLRRVEGWDSKRFGGAPFIITFLFFFTASCEVLIFAF